MTPWTVHKFGGTSVANASRYKMVAKILAAEPGDRKAVVVSAMSGVTDALIALLEQAKARDEKYLAKASELKQKHLDCVRELLPAAAQTPLFDVLDRDIRDITDVLRAVQLSRSYSEATLELVSGYGELWSAQLLSAYLTHKGVKNRWLDARQVLSVVPGETGPAVQWDVSKPKFQDWVRQAPVDTLVITGYVASTPDGVPTTLKRNGSDFSASIFGELADASSIVIWTDVDGVLSADPRRVPEAVVLDEMSYTEAMELAYFGAKVLHPHTMAPALKQGIPIWIRNTLNPTAKGTKIHHPRKRAETDSSPVVKGFSTVDKIALINLEGTGMIGVPGVARRLFGALKDVGVSVIMISQASSEHSICFAVPEAQGAKAKETVEKAFFSEIHHGQVQTVDMAVGCSILAAVGDDMAAVPGVAARFFNALAAAGINIRAIAQGSSERNISVVVDQKDSTRALRAVHAGFYLSDQTISVGVIGPGLIGSALLRQLRSQGPELKKHFKIDLRVRAVANTSKMMLDEQGLDLTALAKTDLETKGVKVDLAAFAAHVDAEHLPHAVIVDCTTSEDVAALYPQWLSRGIHVVTPNKKANSGKLATYKEVQRIMRQHHAHYLYEATVGAGLPVITTLKDLIQTGDRVTRIEGVLSGTLSFLFNTFSESRAFSSVVTEAKKLGYTEPDPRDDLSGMDVARKLVILARELGLALEVDDIAVESLVPEPLRKVASADEYMSRLPEFDAAMAKLQQEATAAGEVLRYVGVIIMNPPKLRSDTANASASVALKRYPKTHSFARTQDGDNIIAFTTARYDKSPLIVQGPGAGPEVTAGGVFADILRLASYLGASS